MTTSLYRFRPLNTHTIDELKYSYLYFSTIDKLNDPMECFYRLFFRGEADLYSNLFKHFLVVMRLVSIDSTISGKESFRKDIATKAFKIKKEDEIFKDIDEWVDKNYQNTCKLLENKQIWENEIKNILKEVYERFYPQDNRHIESKILEYIEQLKKFAIKELLVCCFSKFGATNERDCINLSNDEILMWAHYASGHSGICLEFSDIQPQISLENKLKYKAIDYEKSENYNVKNLQFSVGLALSNGDIKMNFLSHRLWLKDLEYIYNEKYKYIYNTKLDVWEYENEYRYSIFKKDLENQKLKYDFKYLKSITFGERTPQNKRDEITKIIDKKCREHNHKITFYEVYIDDSCGKFKRKPLGI